MAKIKITTNPGFTLIEVMVSMSIIISLSVVFMANYRYGSRQGELNMAAQKVMNSIRTAQNYALGLKGFDDGSGPASPDGGWGCHFKIASSSYIIYADVNNNDNYTVGEEFGSDIFLPQGIVIGGFFHDGVPRDFAHLTFEPPDPTTTICVNPDTCGASELIIVLLDNRSGNTKSIRVNIFGLVEIEN